MEARFKKLITRDSLNNKNLISSYTVTTTSTTIEFYSLTTKTTASTTIAFDSLTTLTSTSAINIEMNCSYAFLQTAALLAQSETGSELGRNIAAIVALAVFCIVMILGAFNMVSQRCKKCLFLAQQQQSQLPMQEVITIADNALAFALPQPLPLQQQQQQVQSSVQQQQVQHSVQQQQVQPSVQQQQVQPSVQQPQQLQLLAPIHQIQQPVQPIPLQQLPQWLFQSQQQVPQCSFQQSPKQTNYVPLGLQLEALELDQRTRNFDEVKMRVKQSPLLDQRNRETCDITNLIAIINSNCDS